MIFAALSNVCYDRWQGEIVFYRDNGLTKKRKNIPTKKAQGGQPDEQEIQANILAEEQDMADELEENVGVPPRKVTMEDVVGAEEAFNDLIGSEEIEIEKTPFRPGKNTKFVLTDRQKGALKASVDEIGKYLDIEINRYKFGDDEANQKLDQLHKAMKKILESGLDSLTPEERNTVDGFSDVMNSEYSHDGGKNLIQHMDNYKGPYRLNMSNIHWGLDMLGVMTGNPAKYKGNRAERLKDSRAYNRAVHVKDIMSARPGEAKELVDTAEKAGLQQLQEQFKGTEIGKKLGQISIIVNDLGNFKYGSHDIEEHLKAADGLGAFLNAKGENGKTNYDTIAEALLGNKKTSEKKQEFDLLLGQLNTVCDLDKRNQLSPVERE